MSARRHFRVHRLNSEVWHIVRARSPEEAKEIMRRLYPSLPDGWRTEELYWRHHVLVPLVLKGLQQRNTSRPREIPGRSAP